MATFANLVHNLRSRRAALPFALVVAVVCSLVVGSAAEARVVEPGEGVLQANPIACGDTITDDGATVTLVDDLIC